MASVAQQSGSKDESFEAAAVAAVKAAEKTAMADQSDKPAVEKPGQTDNKKRQAAAQRWQGRPSGRRGCVGTWGFDACGGPAWGWVAE